MADWFGTETKTHDARNASDDRDDAFFSKRGYTHKEERDVGWQGNFGLKERKHRPDNWAHNQDMGRDHQQVHDDTHGHRDHLSRTLNPDRMPSQARETQTRTNQGTLGSHGLHEGAPPPYTGAPLPKGIDFPRNISGQGLRNVQGPQDRWNINQYDVHEQTAREEPSYLESLHDIDEKAGLRIPNKSKEGDKHFDFRDDGNQSNEADYLTGLHDLDMSAGMRIPNKTKGNDHQYDVYSGKVLLGGAVNEQHAVQDDGWDAPADPAWVRNKHTGGVGFGGIRVPNKSDHVSQTFDIRDPPPDINPRTNIQKWRGNKTYENFDLREQEGDKCWLDGLYDEKAGMRIPNKTAGNESTFSMQTSRVLVGKEQDSWLGGLHDTDYENGMRIPNKTVGNENSFDVRNADAGGNTWDSNSFADGAPHKMQPKRMHVSVESYDWRKDVPPQTDNWTAQSNDKTHGLKVPNRVGMRDQVETYRWDRPSAAPEVQTRTAEGSDWLDAQMHVPNRNQGNKVDDGYDYRRDAEPRCWLNNSTDRLEGVGKAGMRVPNRSAGNYQTFDFRGQEA